MPRVPNPDQPSWGRRTFSSRPEYALARSACLGLGLALVVLIGLTGAGTEGQPTLAAWLWTVVGAWVAMGFLIAYAGWRLMVDLDGRRMTVRRLRTRTLDLARVVHIGAQATPSDRSLLFTATPDASGSPHRMRLPMTTILGTGEVEAWQDDEKHQLLRAVFEQLPDTTTFDADAAAVFAAVGCHVEANR